MGRPPIIPPEKKTRIVLAILAGEKAKYIDAGRTALVVLGQGRKDDLG